MQKMTALGLAALVTGCTSDADMAANNLAKAAEQFEINRRVVFYNGNTDSYILSIEGRCSVEILVDHSEVTCRTSESEYKKHLLRESDNTTMFVEQLDAIPVDVFHYRVIFKPEAIAPNVDLVVSDQASLDCLEAAGFGRQPSHTRM